VVYLKAMRANFCFVSAVRAGCLCRQCLGTGAVPDYVFGPPAETESKGVPTAAQMMIRNR
jgi:hypothetical protein